MVSHRNKHISYGKRKDVRSAAPRARGDAGRGHRGGVAGLLRGLLGGGRGRQIGQKARGGGSQPSALATRQAREEACRSMLSAKLKLTIIACVFGCLWLMLWARAGHLQLVQGPKLASMAIRQHVASLKVAGPRGHIYDRNGLVLAKSVEFTSIYCRPGEVKHPKQAAAALAAAMRISPKQAYTKLTSKSPFVWVRRQVDDRVASAVREANIPGVYLSPEYGRQYPNTILAGQLLGFVGLDDKGLSGIEQAFDDTLRGKEVTVRWQRDAAGRPMALAGDALDPMQQNKGGDLRLTLDATVQMHAQEALAKAVAANEARWGGAIVVDVPTAEVLAWAEYPFFNPNVFRNAPSKVWRSGMAIDALEMGSVMKPFVMAAALQERLVSTNSTEFCEHGRWNVGRRSIKDTHGYGELTMSEIIRYSSNICTAKLGFALGKKRLRDYYARLGFGSKVGLGLPGEATGILRPAGAWKEIDLATASFGQGFSVTIPQLAKAFLCLTYDGILRPLSLIQEPAPETTEPGVRVFDPSVTWDVLAMMQEVVESNGTGRRARIPGVTVAGKTGTAQKALPTGGYGSEYEAVFVGLFPVENPKYLIAVVVDEPKTNYYGGVVSAPAFREIAMKTMASMGTLPEGTTLQAEAQPAVSTEELDQPGLRDGIARVYMGSAGQSVRQPIQRNLISDKAPVPLGLLPKEREPVLVADGTVPDFQGGSLRTALEWFARYGVLPEIKGEGLVVSRQDPSPGAVWNATKASSVRCVLWLGKQAAHRPQEVRQSKKAGDKS